ncbi:MAG: beta-propeller fold lactonase family protein [Eubacteriales bacterium]
MKTRLVSIGSYSQPIVLGTGETSPGSGDGVTVFRMDEQGNLTRLFSAGKPNPTYLALSPDRKFLYTVNELKKYHEEPSAAVSAYAINAGTGEITFLNRRMSGGADACYAMSAVTANICSLQTSPAAVSPRFRSNRMEARHRVLLCAALWRRRASAPAGGPARPPDDAGPFPASICSSPTWARTKSPSTGSTGARLRNQNAAPTIRTEPGDGPRQFVFDQSGRFPVSCQRGLSNTVHAYRYNAETGEAEFPQSLPRCQTSGGGQHRRLHQAAPQAGSFSTPVTAVTTASRAIACIPTVHIDAAKHHETDGKTPRDFNITPEGDFLLAGFQDSDFLALYRIDPRNGQLTEVERESAASSTAVLFADYE